MFLTRIGKLKRTRLILVVALLSGVVSCSNTTQSTEIQDTKTQDTETTVIKVAASATPMTDAVLAAASVIEDGYEIELVETTGYFTPNIALRDGEVDANFIQHKPHMQDFNDANNAQLVVVAPIYFVVGSFYSREYQHLDDLPDEAKIVIPNDSNQGRALELLANEDLIILDPSVAEFEATLDDIIDNPRRFKFTGVELMNLNVAYDEADAVYNLGSFARQIGLFPDTDGIASESDERFAVSLVAREDNVSTNTIKALTLAFTSEAVRNRLVELDQKVAF